MDDEERFRANLQKMLGAQGLTVRAAGSGAEALEELKLNPYDVIVLDIRMPGMDGLATLKEIKKINPEVEVIILSGHASMDAAMEINRLGGYDYLMKPCPLEELLLKIEAAYEKKVEREKRTKRQTPQPPEPESMTSLPLDACQQEVRCAVHTLHNLRQAVFPQRIVQIPLLLAPMMKPLKIKAAMINRAAMMAKGAR